MGPGLSSIFTKTALLVVIKAMTANFSCAEASANRPNSDDSAVILDHLLECLINIAGNTIDVLHPMRQSLANLN